MNINQVICPRCGKENEQGTKICTYCGKKIYSKFLTSLLDVLIIFVVFGILAAIAIPNFYRYPCGSRNSPLCKQSEAKQNLGAIFTAYTSYHSDYSTYPSSPFIIKGKTSNCLTVTKWEPRVQKTYSYNCMDTEAFSPAANDSPCPSGITTTAAKDSFTIAACGNIDKDDTIDVWTIDDAKHLRNVVNDVKY